MIRKTAYFYKRTGVFIDAANLERSVQDLGTKPPRIKKLKKGFHWKALPKGYYKIDYKKLLNFFKKRSKLVSISFYSARFDTKSHNDFLTFLKSIGFKLVTKPIKSIANSKMSISRKCNFCNTVNEVDIRFKCKNCQKNNYISIERKANFDVEISADAIDWVENYDTFVLFSGDSDFAYLLKFLRRKGKNIMVVSERGHVSKELVSEADIYRDLHTFKKDFVAIRKQKSRR